MLLLLSPSKTLDYETPLATQKHTQPRFLEDSKKLAAILKTYPEKKLSALMDISPKLAALNFGRYQSFKTPFTAANARPAILAFKGDVYTGIEVDKYKEVDFAFAQQHVRILSGLYGLLRPLDLIQPYRLEMGIKLANPAGRDLYRFWGERITGLINEDSKTMPGPIVNLASEEYFHAVKPKMLDKPLVNIVFKEDKKGKLAIVALFAKKARGEMANYVVRHRIKNISGLKKFNENGYIYQPELSHSDSLVFVR